jgi:hypothetical protein
MASVPRRETRYVVLRTYKIPFLFNKTIGDYPRGPVNSDVREPTYELNVVKVNDI